MDYLIIIGMVITVALANSIPISSVTETASLLRPNLDAFMTLPVGDPRRCFQMNFGVKSGNGLEKFEVLPGFGWDNLRNVNQGQVVDYNYSQCLTTSDGRYLLPDSVSVVPVKASQVQSSAELIKQWTEYRSSDTRTINLDLGFGVGLEFLFGFSIGGSYSSEYQDVKMSQYSSESYTARSMLRYPRYDVHLQPYAPLHPGFKKRVLAIAEARELNDKKTARYLSQLLVRDFGTHVVTVIQAGASLEQLDQLRQSDMDEFESHQTKYSATASASFFAIFDLDDIELKLSGNMKAGTSSESDSASAKAYESARVTSKVVTRGGPAFRPANFSLGDWASQIDSNLVAIDRDGDPLHFFITDTNFPELPASTLNEVHDSIKQAVVAYYHHNAIPGCTKRKAPNFSISANVDDGTCKKPFTNLTFAGMFQTCEMKPGFNDGDLCSGFEQKNPLTGDYTCPANYEAVLLHTGNRQKSDSKNVCKDYWLFKICHEEYYHSEATLKTSWCVASGPVPPDSGMYFGGLFTSQLNNPLTNSKSCPSEYIPLRVGAETELQVCVSSDDPNALAIPFGGFISCTAGNLLAKNTMQCPDGYNRHLAAVDEDCQISYCIVTSFLNTPTLTPVKRPPFLPTPPLRAPPEGNIVVFDTLTHTWQRDRQVAASIATETFHETFGIPAGLWSRADNPVKARVLDDMFSLSPSMSTWQSLLPGASNPTSPHQTGLTSGAISGIAVGATVGCVLGATLVLLVVRAQRRRRRGRSQYREIGEDWPSLNGHPEHVYGSANTTGIAGSAQPTEGNQDPTP